MKNTFKQFGRMGTGVGVASLLFAGLAVIVSRVAQRKVQ